MRMSFGDKPADKNEMISFMHQAVDRGVGHIRALVQQPLAFD